jgi:hypothetical protein
MQSRHRTVLRVASVLAAVLGTCVALPRAAEAARYVYRPLTLQRGTWELGLGLGVGRLDAPDATGLGLNLEAKVGLTSFVQLGLRSGVRFGNDGQITRADIYGRTFETETYGTGGDDVANPEVSLRWALVHGGIVELGLDGRIYLPFDDDFGFMVALPMLVHLGGVARLDTGVYVPVIMRDETDTTVSIPLHLWFQLDGSLHLGPLTGVRFRDGGDEDVPLGFGIGTALSYDVDLRAWLLFPDVSEDGAAKNFGLGVGLNIRL